MAATAETPAVQTLRQFETEAEKKYREAVLRSAQGETIEPVELRGILFDADRTKDEFRQHVELATRRYEASKQLERRDELQRELLVVTTEHLEAVEKANALKAEYREKLGKLESEVDRLNVRKVELRNDVVSANSSAMAVLGSCPTVENVEHYDRLSRELPGIETAIGDCEKQLDKIDAAALAEAIRKARFTLSVARQSSRKDDAHLKNIELQERELEQLVAQQEACDALAAELERLKVKLAANGKERQRLLAERIDWKAFDIV